MAFAIAASKLGGLPLDLLRIFLRPFSRHKCLRFLALHLKRFFDNAGLPTTKPRDSALRAVTKEVVGIRVLLSRSPFAGDIPRRFSARFSSDTDFCSLAILIAAQNEAFLQRTTYPLIIRFSIWKLPGR